MKKQSLKFALMAMFILPALHNVNAQENQIKKKIQISYGFMGGQIQPGEVVVKEAEIPSGNTLIIDADLLKLSPKLSGGFHLGFGVAGYESIHDGVINNTLGVHYGIDLHYSLLPLNRDKLKRWELSLNASLGSYFMPYHTMQIEYGLGVKLEYYLFDKFGLFAESAWGKYQYGAYNVSRLGLGNTMLKLGVSYRF